MLELSPDLLELGIDHAFWHGEVMSGRQLIEQAALHLCAGETSGLLLQLAAHQLFQLVEAFQTQLLGKGVVNRGFGLNLHRFHGHIELGFLPGKVFRLIILGEGHSDGLFITCLHTCQLLFKAGDKCARAQNQRSIFRFAAFELLTASAANKIDDQLIAISRFLRLGSILVALVLASDTGNRLVNRLVRNRHDQLFEFEPVSFRSLNLGQNFQLDRDFGVLAFFIAFAKVHSGLHRGAQLLIRHQSVHRFANRIVEHLRMKLLAMHLAHKIRRNFAGPEAGHVHLRRNPRDFGIDFLAELARCQLDSIGALEPFIGGFRDIHGV